MTKFDPEQFSTPSFIPNDDANLTVSTRDKLVCRAKVARTHFYDWARDANIDISPAWNLNWDYHSIINCGIYVCDKIINNQYKIEEGWRNLGYLTGILISHGRPFYPLDLPSRAENPLELPALIIETIPTNLSNDLWKNWALQHQVNDELKPSIKIESEYIQGYPVLDCFVCKIEGASSQITDIIESLFINKEGQPFCPTHGNAFTLNKFKKQQEILATIDDNPDLNLRPWNETVANSSKTFKVILVDAGNQRIQVMSAIRKFTNCDLQTAKELVDNVPVTLKENLSLADAEKFNNSLLVAGAVRTEIQEMIDIKIQRDDINSPQDQSINTKSNIIDSFKSLFKWRD